eukprot:6190611-Pleurochrysis_carterae.AAC.2
MSRAAPGRDPCRYRRRAHQNLHLCMIPRSSTALVSQPFSALALQSAGARLPPFGTARGYPGLRCRGVAAHFAEGLRGVQLDR